MALLDLLEQDPAVAVDDRLRQPRGARSCRAPTAGGRTAPARTSTTRRNRRTREAGVPARARRGTRTSRPAPATESRRRSPAPPRACRSPCRRTGSRRRPAAPSARSARSGRPRSGPRTPAPPRTTPRRARRRQERRDRLGNVGHVGGDAVSRGRRRAARSPAAIAAVCERELRPRPLTERAQLRRVPQRHRIRVPAAEDVLGDSSAASPGTTPRRASSSSRAPARAASRTDPEALDDRAPERLEVGHRPPPQLLVGGERQAPRVRQPARVSGQRGALDPLLGRRPQQFRGGGGHRPGSIVSIRCSARQASGRSPTRPTRGRAGRHRPARPGRQRGPARRPLGRPPRGADLVAPLRLNLLQGSRRPVGRRPEGVRGGRREHRADRPADARATPRTSAAARGSG